MSILLPANVTNMVHLAIVIYMVVFCFVYPYNTIEYTVEPLYNGHLWGPTFRPL